MNRKIYYLLIAIAAMCITLFATCKKDEKKNDVPDDVKVTSVSLDKDALALVVGETETLTATVLPEEAANKTVTWESSDPTVAEVVEGLITALKQGTATITVTTVDGNFSATCSVEVGENIEIEMILVEGGTFTMGCSDDECYERELPTHQVTVSSFQISKNLVTQKQWETIMGRTIAEQAELAGYPDGLYGVGDDYPVYYVSWDDAQKFIQKLNAATGKQYRLATEAEWEYAARGGNKSQGYKYSGSNDINEGAWYDENSELTTHPVGTKAPNELGIYDMSGNLWEWCHDRYGEYTDEAQTNPQGPAGGFNRVLRGGSWYSTAADCRVSDRGDFTPSYRIFDYGVRLVLVP